MAIGSTVQAGGCGGASACPLRRIGGVLPLLRHAMLCGALVLLVLKPFFISPFMVAGGLLSLLHVGLHYREIPLRRYWPLLLTVGYFAISALATRYSIVPGSAGRSISRRVAYALVPLMLVDLPPRRAWGSAVLLGILVVDFGLLFMALRDCITVGADGWSFSYLLPGYSPADYPLSLENFFFSQHSRFYYATFTLSLHLWPSFVGLGNLLGMLVVSSRVLRGGERSWGYYVGYALLLCTLLPFFIVVNSRTNLLGAVVCMVLFVGWVVIRRRGWVRWVALGVMGLMLVGTQFTRLNISNVGWEDFDSFIERDARLSMWRSTFRDREHWLPWGVGTAGTSRYLVAHHFSNVASYSRDNDEAGIIRKVHNEFLEAFLEMGYPGGLYLLSIFLLPLLYLRRFPLESLCLFASIGVLMCFESIGPMLESIMAFAFIYNLAWVYGISQWRGEGSAGL